MVLFLFSLSDTLYFPKAKPKSKFPQRGIASMSEKVTPSISSPDPRTQPKPNLSKSFFRLGVYMVVISGKLERDLPV